MSSLPAAFYGIGYCFIACGYIVMKYWADKYDPRQFNADYKAARDACSGLIQDAIGIAPGRMDDAVRIIKRVCLPTSTMTFDVKHEKNKTISDLEESVLKEEPIIAIYDHNYYQKQIRSNILHTSVIIGYDERNLIINDDTHGAEYSLSRSRFHDSWALRDGKVIFIRPKDLGLEAFSR